MAQGKKQTRQQKRKVKRNQAQQHSNECAPLQPVKPPVQPKVVKPPVQPKVVSRVEDMSGTDRGVELLLHYADRPVWLNPKTGDFTLTLKGFPLIPTGLSCIYVFIEKRPGRRDYKQTSRGIKSLIFNGNGHRLMICLNMGAVICCYEEKPCGVALIRPRDENDESQVYEIELCPKHLHEQVTAEGFALPTSRDLTPPSTRLSVPLPNIKTAEKMMADLGTKHGFRYEGGNWETVGPRGPRFTENEVKAEDRFCHASDLLLPLVESLIKTKDAKIESEAVLAPWHDVE